MKLRFYLVSLLFISICFHEAAAQRNSVTRPEERGEDLSSLSQAALFQRLDTVDLANICAGRPHENPSCIELRKICRVLGDRYLAGTLSLNKKEKQTIFLLVEAYLAYYARDKEKEDGFFDGFSEANSQCYRLWGLAYPALVAHVTDNDPDVAQFATNTLLDMRNEEVIRFFADLAKHETNWRRRGNWMRLLGFIGETVNSYLADDTRTPIDTAMNRRLYEKYAKAVFEEYKATLVHPSTRIPCPEDQGDTGQAVQPTVAAEVTQTPGFEDTLYWVRAALVDVRYVLKSSHRAAPALGETTITIDSAYILSIKTMKNGTLLESKVNVKDLDLGENGVYFIPPVKAGSYPGFSIKVKPERPDVKQFKNSKMVGNTRELEFYLPDQQYVEWLILQFLHVSGFAQGMM
ncbi:MAG: hypothetical protein GC192_02555 [Bacteroidetes bacterium]|nr:hypothetical protein [Bacteroidota bacterium]